MSRLIITTVGTSLITNECYPKEYENEIKAIKTRGEINNVSQIISKTAENINSMIQIRESSGMFRDLPAEIASLLLFKDSKDLGLNNDDVILLLSTDTSDGKFCADVIKGVIDKVKWCTVRGPETIKGLITHYKTITYDKDEKNITTLFVEEGRKNLKVIIDKELKNNSYISKYFNITGGYKGIIPFSTILAFENKMSLVYLYEENNDLIVIPAPERFTCSYEDVNPVIYITERGA